MSPKVCKRKGKGASDDFTSRDEANGGACNMVTGEDNNIKVRKVKGKKKKKVDKTVEVETLVKGSIKEDKKNDEDYLNNPYVRKLKSISNKLRGSLFSGAELSEVAKQVLEAGSNYEALLMNLICDNERLKGRVEAMSLRPVLQGSAAAVPVKFVPVRQDAMKPAEVVPVVVRPVNKPVETWSVVVRSKSKVETEELVNKVCSSSLGVRVHDMKPIRGGGVLIRTPILAKREKVVNNGKFKELGMEVVVNEGFGIKAVVQGVSAEISPQCFMEELYELLNFKEKMDTDRFKKSVKLVSRAWCVETGKTVNVVLEGLCAEDLLSSGRCYIKFSSYRVRSFRLMK